MADWTLLPNDILDNILERLLHSGGFFAAYQFGLVCKSWFHAMARLTRTPKLVHYSREFFRYHGLPKVVARLNLRFQTVTYVRFLTRDTLVLVRGSPFPEEGGTYRPVHALFLVRYKGKDGGVNVSADCPRCELLEGSGHSELIATASESKDIVCTTARDRYHCTLYSAHNLWRHPHTSDDTERSYIADLNISKDGKLIVELRDPDQDAGYVSVRNNKLECIRKIPLPTGWQIRSIPKMFLAENACDVFLELNSLTTPPFVLVKAALTQRRLDENEWTEVVGSVSHVWQHFTSGDFAIDAYHAAIPQEICKQLRSGRQRDVTGITCHASELRMHASDGSIINRIRADDFIGSADIAEDKILLLTSDAHVTIIQMLPDYRRLCYLQHLARTRARTKKRRARHL